MTRRFRAGPLPALGERVVLSADVSHHLLRVVQVPRGSEVLVFDGGGSQARARLVDVVDGCAVVCLLEPPAPAAAERRLVLIAGLPRKPAWEHSLRMATELGVTEVRAFVAERSVARGLHPERWARIIAAAAGQCGRGDLPGVTGGPALDSVLEGLPDQRFVCLPGAPAPAPEATDLAVLVGPEGGLSEREVAAAAAAGFTPLGLSRWTLRADTAVAAALALLA